jgi:dipeptidase E
MYLSSFRLGNCGERLVALAGRGRRVAVIANALDVAAVDVRRAGVERELDMLTTLGFAAEELDLRDYFADHAPLAADLRRYGMLWVRGGNVFMLRVALARSGADTEVRRLVGDDTIVYAGYSAGPCVLAPSLCGLEAVDDPDAVVETYGEPPIWEGLGLLDHAIVPHFESPDHPESERIGVVADQYRTDGVPHQTLRDGEVLVIDGEHRTICR